MSLKLEASITTEVDKRKDPTTFLPEEEMCYEIKKKKKKKKKKQEDPFKDVEEKLAVIREPDITALDPDIGYLDPEVTIKVEDIEVELNINDLATGDGLVHDSLTDAQTEPSVTLTEQNHDAFLLTFENIISDNLISEKLLKREKSDAEPPGSDDSYFCEVCHLAFKTSKSLDIHQKRTHTRFRSAFVHVCDTCGMSYEFKNSLVAHIRRKHSPDSSSDDMLERACDICALVFKGTNRLRMHMRRKHGSHEDSFTLECQHCGLTYDKQCSLLVHVRRKHTHKANANSPLWLTCPFCAKVFHKRETYTRHIQRNHRVKEGAERAEDDDFKKRHTNEKTGELTCGQCPLGFSSVSYLKWHMRRKHNAAVPDFRLKCNICDLSYANSESLKRHVRRKHDRGTFCFECNRQFPDTDQYLNHSHARDVKECSVCGLIFANQGGLAKHLRCTHKIDGPKKIFCQVCEQGFRDKRQLKLHNNRVHLKLSYACQFCGKVFRTRDVYRRHVLAKHPSPGDAALHRCDKCPDTFPDEFELCRHKDEAHGDSLSLAHIKKEEDGVGVGDPFRCTKCSEHFASWELLRAHFERTHHLVEEVQCQICGALMSRGELMKHMKVHDEIEVRCRYCEFSSKNRLSMTQHMLRHQNAETLRCDRAGCRYKTFYEHAMLKHRNRHQEIGVKLQCASCPFQTMNKYILKYHEQAHATGDKRYKCDRCEYATVLPANLVQHKYKHSTDKRFKCEVCPFASKYNTSLRFHVRKKHCDLPTPS